MRNQRLAANKHLHAAGMIAALALAFSACAHPQVGRQAPRDITVPEMLAAAGKDGEVLHNVRIRGVLFPMAPNSVFLMLPEEKLAPDTAVPQPEQCLQLLPSRGQFQKLKPLQGRSITVEGDVEFAVRHEDSVLINVRVSGRYAHPYCRYDNPGIPLLVLKRWVQAGDSHWSQ